MAIVLPELPHGDTWTARPVWATLAVLSESLSTLAGNLRFGRVQHAQELHGCCAPSLSTFLIIKMRFEFMDVRRRVAVSGCSELLDKNVRHDVTQKRPGPQWLVSRHELLSARLKP
jgi:hypothetical protein